jgi:hypothetical protein
MEQHDYDVVIVGGGTDSSRPSKRVSRNEVPRVAPTDRQMCIGLGYAADDRV